MGDLSRLGVKNFRKMLHHLFFLQYLIQAKGKIAAILRLVRTKCVDMSTIEWSPSNNTLVFSPRTPRKYNKL